MARAQAVAEFAKNSGFALRIRKTETLGQLRYNGLMPTFEIDGFEIDEWAYQIILWSASRIGNDAIEAPIITDFGMSFITTMLTSRKIV